MDNDTNQPVTHEWIVARWGNTIADLGNGFSLGYLVGKLCLGFNSDGVLMVRCLREAPTRQDVVDAERVLGVSVKAAR